MAKAPMESDAWEIYQKQMQVDQQRHQEWLSKLDEKVNQILVELSALKTTLRIKNSMYIAVVGMVPAVIYLMIEYIRRV